jgi:hypothetical protein
MAIKTFTTGEVLTASDTNTYLANSGLVYITQATIGSGVNIVNMANCFSSTYDNYRVTIRANSGTDSQGVLMQYGTGTATTSNYKSFLNTPFASWTSGADTSVTATDGSFITFAHPTNLTGVSDVFGPNLAVNTTSFGSYATDTNGGITAGIQTDNTQFTSLHIATGGTITGGTITVYGYRKA